MNGARYRFTGTQARPTPDAPCVTIKFRNEWEYLQRSYAPSTFAEIDVCVAKHRSDFVEYSEHESGPELLVWAALGTAGLTLAREVVELIREILAARNEGVKKGEPAGGWIRITVSRDKREGNEPEVTYLEIKTGDLPSRDEIDTALHARLRELPPEVSDDE